MRSVKAFRTLASALFLGILVPLLASLALAATRTPTEIEAELSRLATTHFAEPLIASAITTAEENTALLDAVERYRQGASSEDISTLTAFLTRFPDSGWSLALLTNLGLNHYQAGRFGQAITAWEAAWQRGKMLTEPRAKALTDRALGELMRMHARLGHSERLAELFNEMGDRPVSGSASELVAGAREGLWMMRNEPGVSYLCGPVALKNLLLAQGRPTREVRFLDDYRSGPKGVSLTEVDRLAHQAQLLHVLIYRTPGQALPVPSVVHWKVSHYAAIVGERDGRYHLQDPIFGEDLWVTREAIDQEASGYFLVPGETLAPGWRKVDLAEAQIPHGMGFTGSVQPTHTTPQDDHVGGADACGNQGMCGYRFTEMVVSLSLRDVPVGYRPPKGPAVKTVLTYNQREASQPANFGFFNVSPKWSLNWLSYIQDSPTMPGTGVSRAVAGGGSVNYSGYNTTTGQFTPETRDGSVLVRTGDNPITYERRLPDGSREVYSRSSGAPVAPRRVFLTQLIDSAGNAVTLDYDAQLRLTTVTDAIGQQTTFAYDNTAWPLVITQITDPFGRHARLDYDTAGRLSQITDVMGLTSSFHYTNAGLIDRLTTPYGVTTFVFGESGDARWVQATDPLGQTERLEYRQQAPGIPFSDPANTLPSGNIAVFNLYINGRNTFYWDQHAYALGAGDYTKARIKHWTHGASNINFTTPPVESLKEPLENRVWFNYPGQSAVSWGSGIAGTLDRPRRIGRVLDDGATQLVQYDYNALGNVTKMVDATGRETRLTYAPNGMDVVRVAQKTGAASEVTLAEFTYNDQHRPLTATDAAGHVTRYAYNAAGQLTGVTDALNQTTTYVYDAVGHLIQVINAQGQVARQYTYDANGRVASDTDAGGHTRSYRYDDFDRVTAVGYPDGTQEVMTWDKLDLASLTDREGRVTHYAYDAVRQLTAVTDPLGRVTRFSYYPNGTLKTLTDAKGHITTWQRDLQSRVTAQIDAEGRQTTLAYEGTTSRLRTATDGLGQTTRYTYALDNRLSQIDYLNAQNATPSVRFDYDPWFARVQTMTDGTGATHYSYGTPGQEGALQLQQIEGPDPNDTVAYDYDALGRVSARRVDASQERYRYDALGRTTEHDSPLGHFIYTYLGETDQPTGLYLAQSTLGTAWRYADNLHDRRLLALSNGNNARSYRYTTTPTGRITQIAEGASTPGHKPPTVWNYTYDLADRLLGAQGRTGHPYAYTYDVADNLLALSGPGGSTTLTVNAVNQLTHINRPTPDADKDDPHSIPDADEAHEHDEEKETDEGTGGTAATRYDANGNLLDDRVRTYQWDAANRLIRIDYPATPERNTQFRYDGLSRRVAIVSSMGTTTTETRYLWCGEHLCQARDASHTVIRRYYPEGELRPTDSTTPRRYYGRDHLGSIRDVLALPGGKNIGTADYTPYGKPTKTTGKAKTDFRYAGMFYLPEAGLYLTHYRVYDPALGRWLSRDPIGEKGGVNLYAYVGNDPVNWSDPSGQCPWCFAIWGVIEIGLAIYDWYDTGSTLLDPCASTQDKFLSGGLFLLGAVAPGGGYTALDDLSQAAATAAKSGNTFDQARREAFENAGMIDPSKVKFNKVDETTGTVVEFKGPDGAKIGYDGPHKSPGAYHDKQHISWQSAGKRERGGTKRGNIPYDGPRHPSRPDRKDQ